MKKLLLPSLLVLLASIVAHGQIAVTCGPPKFKPQSSQYRGDVKHRAPGSPTGPMIGANNMYGFPNITVARARAAQHASMPGTKERKTFTLDAFLWQAKVESNDCEIHLELSDSQTNVNSRRVIVEIPPDPAFSSDYQTILRLIEQKFPGTSKFGPDVPFRFTTPVHMQITGFGFFDGVHKGFASASKPNGGHGSVSVQTFWELHPAWNAVLK